MSTRQIGVRWVVVGCLLIVLCGGIAVGADSTQIDSEAEIDVDDTDIVEVQSLVSDPREGDTARYELTYHLGDEITELVITLPETDGDAVDGFTEVRENTFEWDGETREPVLEVDQPVDQSAADYDGLDFAGTDDWALVGAVSTVAEFAGFGDEGDFSFERTIEHEFEGIAGDEMAYVGPYDGEIVETDTGEIQVITADEATPPRSPEEVGEILSETAEQFHITDRRDALHAYIVTDPIRLGGLATGGNADFWVHEDSLESPRTTLWHEYVHSQQHFRPESDVSWTVEGEADYYAYLLAMKQGEIEYHDFYAALEGADETHSDAILADPGTWDGNPVDYELGALTLAALDSEIREASAGTDTYKDVMETKNEEGGDPVMERGSVSDSEFESFATDAARTDISQFFDSYIRSEPDSLAVPGPETYEVEPTDSDLVIDTTDSVAGTGTEERIEFTITNAGDGTSIVPFVTVDAPDGVSDGELGVNTNDGVASEVTAVDEGWALDHLEPGESVVVEYIFDAPDDESAEPEQIDALVTDRGGESAATSSELEVVDAPEISIDGPDVISAGESATFEATKESTDQDIVSYTWEVTGPVDETIETDDPELSHEFTDPGEYTVVLTAENAEGATATTTGELLVNDQPTVTIDAPEEVSPGEEFLAKAEVTNEFGSYDVEWEANGLEATEERVEFTFASDGERKLSVTVTDEYGESTTESATVVVGDPDESDGIQEEITDAFGPGMGVPVAVLALGILLLGLRTRR